MTTRHQTRGPEPVAGPGENAAQISPALATLFLSALERRRASLRTCLSCGAKGHKDQHLPCGH